MTTTTTRILADIRAQAPGAVEPIINAELFRCVVDLCQDALQIAPPTDASTDPSTWLSDTLWITHQRLITFGTLATIYAQAGKPYANEKLASFAAEAWAALKVQARQIAATETTPTTGVERAMANLRALLPGARDALLLQGLFSTVDELCRDVLQTTPPVHTDPPTNWLSTSLWDEHLRLVLAGTLARFLADPGKSYSNPDLAGVYEKFWLDGKLAARAVSATATQPTSSYARLLANLRTAVPLARDGELTQAAFNTIDDLCRNVIQTTPPSGTNPAAWLDTSLWDEHLRLILNGTLARLLAEPGRPFTTPDLAATYEKLWAEGVIIARQQAATSAAPSTAYDRVMANLRANVHGARDSQIQQELFNTIDELCRNVLQITPPAGSDPSAWLTSSLYEAHYRLLIAGTMVRLLTQPGKPYTDPALAAFNKATYDELVVLARGDSQKGLEALVTDRLMENLRVRLPGSKDGVILLELFNVVDEACRISGLWQEAIPVTLVSGQDLYTITPMGTQIVEVMSVAHPTLDTNDITYDNGQIVLGTPPTAADVAASPLYVTASLAPSPFGNGDSPFADLTQWLPADLWPTHHELLLDGVLGRMMSQIGKPYSNPTFAQFHSRRFRNAMAQARSGVAAGGAAYAPTWSFPRFT